jgi:hypothetical protein
MNLVNELQISAESDDVLTVLRKATRLASKLDVADINEWLRCERDGYPDNAPLPEYRSIKAILVFSTNGPIPVGMGMMNDGILNYPGNVVVDRRITMKMSEIVSWTTEIKENQDVFMTIGSADDKPLRRGFDPEIADQISFMFKLNMAQLKAIPEAVKDEVLEWALELERRNILGENQTFSKEEKAIAHTVIFNINDSHIEQLTNSGSNRK